MRIEIEIPDAWINSDQPVIDIKGENFIYSSLQENIYGIQSQFSQEDNDKNEMLRDSCDKIVKEIRFLIKNKLI